MEKKIHDLFKGIVESLAPYQIINGFGYGMDYEINRMSDWPYPLLYLRSETKPSADSPAQYRADVTIQLLERIYIGGNDTEFREQIVYAKSKMFKIWDVIWKTFLLELSNCSDYSILVRESDKPTLTPLEYVENDGVYGYEISFPLYLTQDTSPCDFTLLAGSICNLIGCP